MISCLESVSREKRNEQIVHNEFTRNGQYNYQEALKNGKAVGGSHGHILPNCKGVLNVIDRSDFYTHIESNAGHAKDIEMRNISIQRSLYNYQRPYEAKLINTELNRREGQVVVSM